ncbi:helix-turn-helix domain-containing protein [Paracoccus sp. (in: a-proteobacteria)]|uniref:helix-turn-helix domain-containing protein n=1 Tax=Paracoccus sp. TaxID=267 RepID=UPI003A4C759A
MELMILEQTCQNQHENETVAERLLIVRRRSGLSQADFAQKIGVIPRSYRNYEAAVRDIPLALVVAVHRVFEVDLTWLILGERPSAPVIQTSVYELILRAIDDFETEQKQPISISKKAKQVSYLSSQFASGRDLNRAEIRSYLETTI